MKGMASWRPRGVGEKPGQEQRRMAGVLRIETSNWRVEAICEKLRSFHEKIVLKKIVIIQFVLKESCL
jgi:hypothetical protein